MIPSAAHEVHEARVIVGKDEEVGLGNMQLVALRRSALSVIVAILLLWVLAQRRLIEAGALVDVAVNAPGTLVGLGVLLLLPIFVGSIRYQAVLRAMAKHVPLVPIFAANVISGAVAVWLPASAGVMEVMRFGLVARSTRGGPAAVSKTDLAVAGLVDRLLGMAAIALVGLFGSLYLLVTAGAGRGGGIWVIVVLTALLAAGCALPFAAVRLPQVERATPNAWTSRPLVVLARVKTALRQVELRSPAFAVASLASLGISFVSVMTTYLAMRLFAPATPLLAVALASPPLTVASVLPGNIAGFGGNQVAAAIVFGALGLDAKAAVLASLLLTAIGLVVGSLAAAILAPQVWPKGTSVDALMETERASE